MQWELSRARLTISRILFDTVFGSSPRYDLLFVSASRLLHVGVSSPALAWRVVKSCKNCRISVRSTSRNAAVAGDTTREKPRSAFRPQVFCRRVRWQHTCACGDVREAHSLKKGGASDHTAAWRSVCSVSSRIRFFAGKIASFDELGRLARFLFFGFYSLFKA